MALFSNKGGKLEVVKQQNFNNEKELQSLIETNMKRIFNCRFLATEFATGSVHMGRIDTLALSEDDNPVIIEYKVVESSQLVNQSLFYLSWLRDHKGDFQVVAERVLGKETKIDWSEIRVICIAPGYKKYDLHAVAMMGANIELWQYKYYENENFFIEEVLNNSSTETGLAKTNMKNGKNPIMVEAGRKAAVSKRAGVYSFEEHLEKAEGKKRDMVLELQKFILELSESVREIPKKYYVAYKVTQNFVCMDVRKDKILLYLKIDAKEMETIPPNCRDVSKKGYWLGNCEVKITNSEEFELAKKYIEMSFSNIGGR